jgi:hypothetical protein
MTITQPPPCTECSASRCAYVGAHGWCNACTLRWYRADRPDAGPPPSYAMRCEDYDWLRSQGLLPAEAADRLGMTLRTARRHEERRAAAGLPTAPVPRPVYMRRCESCGDVRRHGGHGWCVPCYNRWYRAGKPDTGPPPLDEAARRRAHSERATAQHALDTAMRDGGGWGWAA